jgi:molybdopterin adenylyltransferase
MAIASGTRALVLTVSDGVAAGTRQDESGVALGDRLAEAGFVVDRATTPDDRSLIESALRAAATGHALIVTTGGTGLTPRDVTPQATLAVIDYEVPGLAEAMRAAGRAKTPLADLSRGVVGVIGRTLVVNVPGGPNGARESLAAIEPALVHALETLAGPFDHDATGSIPTGAIPPGPPPPPIQPGSPGATPPAPPLGSGSNDPWRDLGPGAVPDPDTDAGRAWQPPGYDPD